MFQIVPIYLLVTAWTAIEAKDNEIDGGNNKQRWDSKVRRALRLSMYHRWTPHVFLSLYQFGQLALAI